MSSSSWRRGFIVILLISLALAGILGFLVFQSFRGRDALIAAEEAYSEGRWVDAKRNFTWYIARHPEDLDVFPQYIESCLNIPNNRLDNVRDAGRAQLRLALSEPSNLALARKVVDFYRGHRLWLDLDYATSVFLRNHPDDPVLMFNRALADGLLGRTSEAIAGYQRLIDRGEANPQAYGNLAALLLKQGYEEQGWQILDDAISQQSDNALIRVERVQYALAVRNIARAIEELEKASQFAESSFEVALAAASVHAANGEYETSLNFAKEAVRERPTSYQGHSLIANNLIALRQIDEAISYLSNLDPFLLADNPQLYLMLAEIQIDAQRMDGADRTIETYKKVAPGDREIFDYLEARRLLEAGHSAEAASKFAVVVERMPELGIARYYLSIAYLESGERDRAKNALEIYLSSYPGDRRAQVLRDSVFADRTAESVKSEAKSLLDSDAPYFASLLSVANSLTLLAPALNEDTERLELTERLYKRAIEDSPSVPQAYGDLAIHLLRQGKADAARQVLEEAYAAGVASSSLDYPAAAIALAGGDLDRAKTLFADRLQLEPIVFEQAVLWITLFASAGHMDTGLELLDTVREQASADARGQELDLVELAVHTRFGNIEQANARLTAMADRYAEEPAMIARLNDYRVSIARLTLIPGVNQDKAMAERLTQSVEQSEPERADGMVLRAQLLLQGDPPDLEGAKVLCAKASELADQDMYLFLVSSEIAYKQGLYAKAKEYATMAHDASSNRLYTGIVLARMQLQVGELSDALATLQDASELAPNDAAVIELMIRAYAGLGRFQEADDLVQRLQDTLGGNVPLQLQASLLIARGDWDTAERALRQMYASDSTERWTIHYLAVVLERQGRRIEAEQFLNDCIARHPEIPDLWVELGKSYLRDSKAGRLADASLAFTQALTGAPDDIPALRGLFEVQLRSDNPGAALGFCNRLLRQMPDDYDMIRQKALLLAQIQGHEREALETVNRAIEIQPRADLYYVRGALYLKLGEFPRALKDFQFVEQSGGDTGGDLDALMAETYLELQNLPLARSYYDAARSRNTQLQRKTIDRLDRLADRFPET